LPALPIGGRGGGPLPGTRPLQPLQPGSRRDLTAQELGVSAAFGRVPADVGAASRVPVVGVRPVRCTVHRWPQLPPSVSQRPVLCAPLTVSAITPRCNE